MKTMTLTLTKSAKSFILASILLSLSFNSTAQDLLTSIRTSHYTYIYRLNDNEAASILKKGNWTAGEKYFHTLVDSFPTGEKYTRQLPPGNYIRTFAAQGRQVTEITTVPAFDLFVLNNNTDLRLQVYGIDGNPIANARVKAGSKILRYDPETGCYTDRKSNRKGLVSVEVDGITTFFDLERDINNSALKRGSRTVLYRTPLKYAWIPVSFVINLPIDAVKSAISGYPRGTINRTRFFFIKSYHRIASIFDSDHYYPYGSKASNQYSGYMVFNKPIYMPGDTVKLKAYTLRKGKQPVTGELSLYLNNLGENIRLTTLLPYAPGGYEYSFLIDDTLNLQLDRNYWVSLKTHKDIQVASATFRYEEYELKGNNLALRTLTNEHYRSRSLTLYARGTDDNNLNLQDARIEVTVLPGKAEEFFGNLVFVPDTIFRIRKSLNPAGETEIVIADTIFPAANMKYKVTVRMLTSDNEVTTETKEISFIHHREDFNITFPGDSAAFDLRRNGISAQGKMKIEASDNFGNKTTLYDGYSPHTIALNPFYASYTASSGTTTTTARVASEPSLLRCFPTRTADSVFISVDNPRQLAFSYNIYRRNSEKGSGHTDSLNKAFRGTASQNYFISLSYLWGGKVTNETFSIPLSEKRLNIEVTEPRLVFPGQQTQFGLLVTDQKGNPVTDADITAFSVTSKFNYSPPQLKDFSKQYPQKRLINNFDQTLADGGEPSRRRLDYDHWKRLASIDSIEYYKFLYPGNDIYRFDYPAEEGITQFAPFVMENGEMVPVHIITASHRPVWISAAGSLQPYSFAIEPGYQNIVLRTARYTILIDSILINSGMKTIISVDAGIEHRNVLVRESKPELTPSEQQTMQRYLMPYRNTFGDRLAYLSTTQGIKLLNHPGWGGMRTALAGPVSGNFTLEVMDSYNLTMPFESSFEYDFAQSPVKMRSAAEARYPTRFSSSNRSFNILDQVLTVPQLERSWSQWLDSRRLISSSYRNPSESHSDNGRLTIDIRGERKKEDPLLLNLLLIRCDNSDMPRVYAGTDRTVHNLTEGFYRLILFYSGDGYHYEDSIYVRPGGQTRYSFDNPDSLRHDDFSRMAGTIIESAIASASSTLGEAGSRQIFNTYVRQFRIEGDDNYAEGIVTDHTNGTPIQGAVVHIRGTSTGAVTDIEGYFYLRLPPGEESTLTISFIGYRTVDIPVTTPARIEVALEPDMLALDEVVVVGYGEQKKSFVTAAITKVRADGTPGLAEMPVPNLSFALAGSVAGMQIDGKEREIMIRGMSAVSGADRPVIIINGMVYTGDISDLDPSIITSIEVLKSEAAMALYGSAASGGAVIFTTSGGLFPVAASAASKGADFDEAFLEMASMSGSLRKNFSDYAFWQPALRTGADGRAEFSVTFPDDVTSWETFYLAMTGGGYAGQTSGTIRSYKPLMARIATPRFLIEGDTSFLIGKVLNYLPDTAKVRVEFSAGSHEEVSGDRLCADALVDSLRVVAGSDSMTVRYTISTEGGWFDGEERMIPVLPAGMESTEGVFHILEGDTTVTLSFGKLMGDVHLYARADILEVLDDEIRSVYSYRYNCNEQLASKLKALMAARTIAEYRDKKFRFDEEVDDIIRQLQNNQKGNGMWGWWKNSDDSEWITLHVIEALGWAADRGYKVRLDRDRLAGTLVWMFENSTGFDRRLTMLHALNTLGASVNYAGYLASIEGENTQGLSGLTSMLLLRQKRSLPYDVDTLRHYERRTIFGNRYYEDDDSVKNVRRNTVMNTVAAYRLFRGDTTTGERHLSSIRNYLFERRSTGYWRNTYESAMIIETLLPDLMGDGETVRKPVLAIGGSIGRTIDEFPWEALVPPQDTITITKSGDFPVYLTGWQRYWDAEPVVRSGDFAISTRFAGGGSEAILEAGVEVTLVAEVTVNGDADYVMINIPIPGGCSYSEKKQVYRTESHREYFRHETTIFCDQLRRGTYTFEVSLIPRYSGTYSLNPAKVELMYFPTFNANNETRKVVIR